MKPEFGVWNAESGRQGADPPALQERALQAGEGRRKAE